MKFETKYLIRWGIPGWILIFWLLYEFLFLKGINPLDSKMVDIKTGLTLLLSLTAIGVPIGYLLHQLYFGIAWVFNNNRNFEEIATKIGDQFPKHDEWGQNNNEDYYQLEYVWHSMLLNQNEETRKYLEERYRYLLSTVHGLGSLFVSLIVSLLGTAIIAITHGSAMNFFYWAGVIIQIAIFLSAIANYKYYSDNLRAFQIKMLKTYL
ncbi:hypothetical protein [Bacillus cabrialesii]|uniref:DUF4328 domain-containing protein n=1 Tax=Bacillus cabrialesii subsp. tritici TaxID=2944916 RepID=A0ABT9DIJ3_9BACI|nr:hypothetical protein [Bacillus cabrialesii]MDO8224523.1 hypothetical protein [Bacillus cabrialesii subsp. tritici]